MDTHGEDMLDIDTATDFSRLVIDHLNKFNLLKDGESFKFNVEQCKSLCCYILDKLYPYVQQYKMLCYILDKLSPDLSRAENNRQYPGRDVWSKPVQRAWKEIYRAVKEAETYLEHCSTDGWRMECVILSYTGEVFALHMHDLAWSLLCLDLAILCPIQAWNDSSYREEVCNRISDFFAEMSGLHLQQFGFKFQDYWHLLIACNQAAAKIGNLTKKNKIGVLLFMERKLSQTIRNECEIESATGIPTWLQIRPKDLVLKKKTIGEGSFGVVYEGSWLGHKVAVKDIPIDARDLFDRETAILAKLQSPFIVQLIGTCIEGSHCYVVMELVSSSLDKLLKTSGGRAPLALPVAVDMMLQISRGMEYLHRQGIMHMDLKASNVLIEQSVVPEFREQGYGRVKLCDFGMASLRLSSFRCEDPKGTCFWRAPEAFPFPNEEVLQEIDSLNEYTYKADVYSFAMTCYEILTGEQPFLDVHPKDLYRMIVQGRRPVLQPPSCPALLADYIGNCWETDPKLRPCFAQISTYMRKMKLFILRMSDPCDWPAKSSEFFNSLEVFLQPATYWEEEFEESPADEKMKSISRILHIVPANIKRKYNIKVAGVMPSEKNAMPSEKSNAQKDHPTLLHKADNTVVCVVAEADGLEIALDVALGLAFLHKSGIAHGNVKSSNVLLDSNGKACLADSCLGGPVKNAIVAEKSCGYMAPEQYNSRNMSKESDVYSFGVLLFELATGKNPSLFNPYLPTRIIMSDANKMVMLRIAMRCCSPHVYKRPTMNNVIEMLVNWSNEYGSTFW